MVAWNGEEHEENKIKIDQNKSPTHCQWVYYTHYAISAKGAKITQRDTSLGV